MARSNEGNNKKTTRDEIKDIKKEGPGTPDSMNTDDLQDSVSDEERLKQETTFVELPEVRDIPGQENISSIGPLGEMADTTISSDDEEGIVDGVDLLDESESTEDDETDIVMGTEADVDEEDLRNLGRKDQDLDGGDDELVAKEGLDDTDFDGAPLNEAASDDDTTGDDLDIPEADGNDPGQDAMGQGDEENNYYSLGSDDNDNLNEGTP